MAPPRCGRGARARGGRRASVKKHPDRPDDLAGPPSLLAEAGADQRLELVEELIGIRAVRLDLEDGTGRRLGRGVARRRVAGGERGAVVVLPALLRATELARDPVDQLLDATVRLGVALVRDEPLVLARAVEDRLALPGLLVAFEHELDPRLGA